MPRSLTTLLTVAISGLCVVAVLLPRASTSAPPPKFTLTGDLQLNSGCGGGLNENSACGYCNGLSTGATCGHACVHLPSGKGPGDVTLRAFASANKANYTPCGSGGGYQACDIGWSRFEDSEWYLQDGNLCGRFKNWNNTRGVYFRIAVTEN